MKLLKIVFVLAAMSIGSNVMAQANAIDKYFQKYLDDERFTVIYISARLFKMFDNMDINGLDDEESKAVADIAKDLQGLRILTAEENAAQFYKEAKSKINTSEYELLMTVRTKGHQNLEFLIKDGGNGKIEELLLLSGGETEEFLLMSFVGNLDLSKVSKMANEMGKEN
ncbi:MAG: hypothetical protein DHS20C18_47630 [Saprospiraceae bacterium]|nr:MAG: hypothetical protein DHS20C18_47630 [Saprospiraceae bacterium]